MAKITNNARAKQGVWAGGAQRLIAPGAAYEGDVTDVEMVRLKKNDTLKVEGDPVPPPDPAPPTGKQFKP